MSIDFALDYLTSSSSKSDDIKREGCYKVVYNQLKLQHDMPRLGALVLILAIQN
jgi:hypothetical protein